MSSSADFVDLLFETGHTFFTGVPDSVLRGFCGSLGHRPGVEHIPSASEGAAVGLAIGHHLATGRTPVVYLQNSGLWNVLNPFFTLTHEGVYGIPIVFVVGWRGRPGEQDEPQHRPTGERTEALLQLMEIEPFVAERWDANTRAGALSYLRKTSAQGRPAAFLIPPGVLDEEIPGDATPSNSLPAPEITATRADLIEAVLQQADPEDAVIAGIGHTGRELYAARLRQTGPTSRLLRDFLCVGGMGYALQVAIGAAHAGTRRVLRLEGARKIWCLEGDGSFLMHLGGAALAGTFPDLPLICVLLDNAAHASVGGQQTACRNLDYAALARTLGFRAVETSATRQQATGALQRLLSQPGPGFLWARIVNTPDAVLPRPAEAFRARKEAVMQQFQTATGAPGSSAES